MKIRASRHPVKKQSRMIWTRSLVSQVELGKAAERTAEMLMP
jgi:hypothetical protein